MTRLRYSKAIYQNLERELPMKHIFITASLAVMLAAAATPSLAVTVGGNANGTGVAVGAGANGANDPATMNNGGGNSDGSANGSIKAGNSANPASDLNKPHGYKSHKMRKCGKHKKCHMSRMH